MQYTRLGNTGLIVSRLCFGTMTFGTPEGEWSKIAKVGPEAAQPLVDMALDAGINFFDTADAYTGGESERILSQALGKRRQDVIIATKAGFRTTDKLTRCGLSRRHLMLSAEESLRRLNTDYIDLYIVHRDDPFTPLEETLETLDDLVRSGKVRYIGYSNWPAWKGAKAVGLQREHGWTKFTAAQMYYSLIGRDIEHEVIPFVEDAGIGTMIWSPLAGGFLSGKYQRNGVDRQGDRLAIQQETSYIDSFVPLRGEQGFDTIDLVRTIADNHDASVAQVALAWVLAKSGIGSVIVGASKLHQLEDNLGAVDLQLSADEMAQLDEMTCPESPYPRWFGEKTLDLMTVDALS